MTRSTCLLAALLVSVSSLALAGKYNQKLSIGDAAPAWEKLPGTDGKQHSLADLKEKEVVVVVFTCNTCPYAVDYQERINRLAKTHAGQDSKVAVVAICVNKVPEDKLPAMKERAKSAGFVYDYLYDETQQIARDYGANWTPEFFVLNRDRKVVYMGAFDDDADAGAAQEKYVEPAIVATLAGQEVQVKETPAVGCAVRYLRQRKKK
jgi:peroxiredoxin